MKRIGYLAVLATMVTLGCESHLTHRTQSGAALGMYGALSEDGAVPTALMPKSETGADRFLEAQPEHDGRGVVVAIFDTGVDPGAPGLQVTTDGRPKVVDIVDGSGSGDVDTTTVRKLDEDGTLEGLTGRKLTPGSEWKNPTGEYRIGIKAAYDLFPGQLVGRLKREHREDWGERNRIEVEALKRKLTEWDHAHGKPTREELKERANLAAMLEQLEKMQKSFDDPGPVCDCIVFNDGEVWRAAIDTDEDGDFNDEKLLTNYRLEREYATFGDKDLMNFAMNIYDHGDLLSIVADCGSHGTHVAGIVAAYYPDQPELNGVAPGAQIVAVKIGDTRLGSSSVGTGSIRGLAAVLQNDCDLINMSFGGPTSSPNRGRIAERYSEIVNVHGVIFVASAGNAGPAMSTVGGPGGTTEAILGIGATVSREMMADQYSMYGAYDELQYTFSSRGPTMDGDLGVVFTAPGGAISPVPNWQLKKNQQSHGTSMSSPNACGSIALLLSGLKAEEIDYSPHSVRRAIVNTARPVEDAESFTQGAGMVQVDAAWEYLKEFDGYADDDLRFRISVSGREGARGIYLREPFENDEPFWSQITVTPVFHEDADNREKVALDMQLELEATEPWVEVASTLRLMHGGRRFEVEVDPTDLGHGVHTAEVLAFDAESPERGPVFRIPVTVVRTLNENEANACKWQGTITLESGGIERGFIEIPQGATWADLTIKRQDEGTRRRMVAQMHQLLDGRDYSAHRLANYIWMDDSSEELRSMAVEGGGTLEVALAHYWSIPGEAEYEVSLEFHGLRPSPSRIFLPGDMPMVEVDVEAPLRSEMISPSGSLNTLRRTLRPVDSEIRALNSERDRLPKERQIYEMILTYKFELADDTTVTARAALNRMPIDWDVYESLISMIFDKNKRLRATLEGDMSTANLKKGEYTLRFHVRHDDPDHLEGLKDMTMTLDRRLGKSVNLQVFADPYRAQAGRPAMRGTQLEKGESKLLYIGVPSDKAVPKAAKPGDLLVGSMTFGQTGADLTGAGKRPGGYPVIMTVVANPEAEDKPKASDAELKDERTELEKLAEAIRDLKVAKLGKLHGEDDAEAFDALAEEILGDWPNHRPVIQAKLARADKKKGKGDTNAIIAAADEVIEQIDQTELAAYFGVTNDTDEPEAKREREQMDEKKDALVDALFRKARALMSVSNGSADAESVATFDAAYDELRKWTDVTGNKYYELRLSRERMHGRLGEALALVNEKIKSSPLEREPYEQRLELLEELGWDNWVAAEERWMLRRFPKDYPPF